MANWNTWRGWRKRFKEWKLAHRGEVSDADIADAMGEERGTVNAWQNRTTPTITQFMEMCQYAGVDPGEILFERPVIDGAPLIPGGKRTITESVPRAEKARAFKQKQKRLRRRIVG